MEVFGRFDCHKNAHGERRPLSLLPWVGLLKLDVRLPQP